MASSLRFVLPPADWESVAGEQPNRPQPNWTIKIFVAFLIICVFLPDLNGNMLFLLGSSNTHVCDLGHKKTWSFVRKKIPLTHIYGQSWGDDYGLSYDSLLWAFLQYLIFGQWNTWIIRITSSYHMAFDGHSLRLLPSHDNVCRAAS